MWALTASTLRCTSAAICGLVAGVAELDSTFGRHSAISSLRWVSVKGIDGRRLERPRRRLTALVALGLPVDDAGLAEVHVVLVLQPVPAVDPAAVHERAVERHAVVDQRPLAADRLEQRVRSRDLGVPRERDVGLFATTDRDSGPIRGQHQDVLLAAVVQPVQERDAGAFGLDPLLQVAGRNHSRLVGVGHREAQHLTTMARIP